MSRVKVVSFYLERNELGLVEDVRVTVDATPEDIEAILNDILNSKVDAGTYDSWLEGEVALAGFRLEEA